MILHSCRRLAITLRPVTTQPLALLPTAAEELRKIP